MNKQDLDKNHDRPTMANDPFADHEDVMARFYNPVDDDDDDDDPARREKPTHYKVVSISLYLDDIARLDALVKELKRRGFTKMNRSALIRFAIDTVDINKLPRQY
jgi:hypothetical protein